MTTDEDLLKGIFRLCEETGRSCTYMKGQVTIHYQGQKEIKSKNLDETFLKMAEIWTRVHFPPPKIESRGNDVEELLALSALVDANKKMRDGEGQQ